LHCLLQDELTQLVEDAERVFDDAAQSFVDVQTKITDILIALIINSMEKDVFKRLFTSEW